MKRTFKISLLASMMCIATVVHADNQTNTLSPIYPESLLPFTIIIEQMNFQLPVGLHSGMIGIYKGLWIFIAGRTNGLHGFGADPFPVAAQNTMIYVVNPASGTIFSRSLHTSDLTQQQIDSLSVTSPQGYQDNNTLYMTGGYGIDTLTGAFTTKPILTAFNLPGIVKWTMGDNSKQLSAYIQQIIHPMFQITGGEMLKLGNVSQLVFGQNQDGVYNPADSGIYSEQIRRFQISNVNGQLFANFYPSLPTLPDPNYRRRDLNVMPAIFSVNNRLQYGMIAYAGVFTETTGVWTVPVVMDQNGTPSMANPLLSTTFKQGMNQYVSATAGLYSQRTKSMYNIFFGGISYGFYSGGTFQTDSEIPFINQVTTVKMDQNGNFTQYLMNSQYPVILSTSVNPGNQLLFGAGAYYIHANIQRYANGVINIDNIRKPTVIGYIAGGIMSTLPNTNTDADSNGSPYVFKVTLVPRG